MKLKRFLVRYYPPGASLWRTRRRSVLRIQAMMWKRCCDDGCFGATPSFSCGTGHGKAGWARNCRGEIDVVIVVRPGVCTFATGVMLEYEHRDGTRKTKEIDLLQLTPE